MTAQPTARPPFDTAGEPPAAQAATAPAARAAAEPDLLERIDAETAAAETAGNGDPKPGTLEADLRLLLPGHTFWVVGESTTADSVAGFLSAFLGRTVDPDDLQLVASSDGDEGPPCSHRKFLATWSTPTGVWSVAAKWCSTAHVSKGYDVRVQSTVADGEKIEFTDTGLTAAQAADLVKITCRRGLSVSG